MKKGWKLLPVMLLAAALTVTLYGELLRDRGTLRELTDQLTESRAAWENTAAEKEKLQEELKTVQEALKEAKLTLQESTERADKLRAEIAQLRADLGE